MITLNNGVNMEIAKFVLSCVGSFIAVSGFFMGIWKSYSKKTDDKIKNVEESTDCKIKTSSEKLERKISSLEKVVEGLQKEVNANLGQRLSNIEGEMKGMNNILQQIQGWFIKNTPRS